MRSITLLGAWLLLAAVPARAAITVYYRAGTWHAFSGVNGQGELVCGMGTGNPVDGRRLEISYVIGETRLFFHSSKPTWDVPPGSAVPLVLEVGDTEPWTAQAAGRGQRVNWTLAADQIAAFDTSFRQAETMTLSFPGGNEPTWRVSLTGSTAVNDTFRRCISDLTRRDSALGTAAAQAAQPERPTQPFGAAGTQPFAPRAAAQLSPGGLQAAVPATPTRPALPTLPPIPSAGAAPTPDQAAPLSQPSKIP